MKGVLLMKPDYILKPGMELLGIEKLRIHQVKPIQSLLKGKDTVVIAGTASGKSLIYHMPALVHSDKLTLVIEPTLSLIYNQVQSLREHGIEADYIDHFRAKKDVDAVLRKVKEGRLTFLYVTPERLQSKSFQKSILKAPINLVVVDECHCVTEWGATFRDAYLEIGAFIDMLPERPTVCACSATLPEDRLSDIIALLHLHEPNIYRSDLSRKNFILLKKDVTSKDKHLEDRLKKRFEAMEKCIKKYHSDGSVIIYALTTGYVDAIYNYLNEKYPDQVACYHAQMQPESRKHQIEMNFLQRNRKIMVATSAFGMGIDVPDIELCIHFNTPISMMDYIQQIGRGGRDGTTRTYCVLFYDRNGDDKRIARSFIKKAAKQSDQAAEFMEENYSDMEAFINSDKCLTQEVLAYQGQIEKKTCKCCTNCAKNRR